MVTTVVLPAVGLGEDRMRAFQAIEHRFVCQARTAVTLVGLTDLPPSLGCIAPIGSCWC